MPEPEPTPKHVRIYMAITLLAVLLWQVYLCVFAAMRIGSFKALFRNLGAELPVLFRLHGFFWLVPLVGLLLAIDVVRRRKIPVPYAGVAFAALILASLLMQVLLIEGLFSPLWSITEAVK